MENNGIYTLEGLANYSEKEILQFHGMGKSSLPKLKKALDENGLSFDEFKFYTEERLQFHFKIIEMDPYKRIVWLVVDQNFKNTDEQEWKGTTVLFEISEKDGKTHLHFIHDGLVPEYECYQVCNDAWTSYIQGSLKNLITTGKGKPNTKEEGLDTELIEKWNLPKK